jgi:hypothetical protein
MFTNPFRPRKKDDRLNNDRLNTFLSATVGQPVPEGEEADFTKFPGGWFMGRTVNEAMMMLLGYVLAMKRVSEGLASFADVLPKLEVTPETIAAVMPLQFQAAAEIFDYSVPTDELGSWIIGIYSKPENRRIPFDDAFSLARDMCRKKVTNEEFEEKILWLRAQYSSERNA